MYKDVYRVPLLEAARSDHPLRLLVCCICRWSWLTVETARIVNILSTVFEVACLDEYECYRRQKDRVGGAERLVILETTPADASDPFRSGVSSGAIRICAGPGCTFSVKYGKSSVQHGPTCPNLGRDQRDWV